MAPRPARSFTDLTGQVGIVCDVVIQSRTTSHNSFTCGRQHGILSRENGVGSHGRVQLRRVCAMTEKEQAAATVRGTLDQLKQLVSGSKPRLSESDTKANFIEKYIEALGYRGLDAVTREYYVKNSQEFIDYVLRANGKPILAIEAKPLQHDLTDKAAAQLIQYCAVEGIEWCGLTNGWELRLYNQYMKGALEEKLVLKLDLLAYNTDEEFNALFDQLWLISHESMTTPSGIRTWMEHRTLDQMMRNLLLDPASAITRSIRRCLAQEGVQVSAETIAQWYRVHLTGPVTPLLPAVAAEPPPPAPGTVQTRQSDRPRSRPGPRHVPAPSVYWSELVKAGKLRIGDELIVRIHGQESRATLLDDRGNVCYEGTTMSAHQWGLWASGWDSINIYAHAWIERDGVLRRLAGLRVEAAHILGIRIPGERNSEDSTTG